MAKAKTVEEFDRRFDEGEDVFDVAKIKSIERPGLKIRRTNIDLPEHLISDLDRQAARIGTTRQAVIKFFLWEAIRKLKAEEFALKQAASK
jgi:hypothetical protein